MTEDYKPVFHVHMWQGRDTICFNQITPNMFRDMRGHGEEHRVFDLIGNSAVIKVFTEDMSLTRQDALQTATSFVRGWYVSTEIDLEKMEVRRVQGKPIENPPH